MDTPVKFIKSIFVRILIILDIVFLLLLIIFNLNPSLNETIYSKGIYPILAWAVGVFTDLVSFSITELILIVFILVLIIRLILAIHKCIKRYRSFKNIFFHFLKQTFIVVSIVFVWFYFMWGFNYFRLPLESKVKALSIRKEVDEDLFYKVMNLTIDKANNLYTSSITRNNYSYKDLNETVNDAVAITIEEMDDIKLYPAKKMKVSLNNILEITNNLGVISPFFLESHFSKELIDAEFPFIMAHEKSHLFGYANETEANYIAFISCIKSKNKYLQYSAYSQILRYFLSQYQKECKEKYGDDEWEEKYKEVLLKIRKEVRDEYIQQKKRYEKYNTFLSQWMRSLYNVYLKINNIPEGIKAYSRVVKLILRSEEIEDLLEEWDESSMIKNYDAYLEEERESTFLQQKHGDDFIYNPYDDELKINNNSD